MPHFLDTLNELQKPHLEPEDLQDAEIQTNRRFPNTLKLWPFEADANFIAEFAGSAAEAMNPQIRDSQ
jgi:hypothetical protein